MKDVEALIAKLERPGASAEEIAAAAILRSRAERTREERKMMGLLKQIPTNVRIFFAVIVGLALAVGLQPWIPWSTPVTASSLEWNHWARIATSDPRAAASEIVRLQRLLQRCAVPSLYQPADPLDPGAAATEIVRLHAQAQRCSPGS